MGICRTLFILDRHCPILTERAAEYGIVTDLNDRISNPDVDDKASQSKLEFGKLTTAEGQNHSLSEGCQKSIADQRRRRKSQMHVLTSQVDNNIDCSNGITSFDPSIRA